MYDILKKMLYRYMILLKAASQGWIVRYIGGNKYELFKYMRS